MSPFKATLAALLIAAPAAAQHSDDARQRINLSSGQAMLAEEMTQAACLLSVSIQPEASMDRLGQSEQDFARVLEGLSGNGAKIGLADETNASVLAAQTEVASAWNAYSIALHGFREGGFTLDDLDASGRDMLGLTLDAAAMTARAHGQGASGITMGQAMTLNVAGRQRVFSETMLKEMCLIAGGIEPDLNRARYRETVTLFNASLDALINGLPEAGLSPPPSPAIAAKLKEVNEMWQPMRSFMESFAEENAPDLIYLEVIADHMATLEVALEDVFVAYEIETFDTVKASSVSGN